MATRTNLPGRRRYAWCQKRPILEVKEIIQAKETCAYGNEDNAPREEEVRIGVKRDLY